MHCFKTNSNGNPIPYTLQFLKVFVKRQSRTHTCFSMSVLCLCVITAQTDARAFTFRTLNFHVVLLFDCRQLQSSLAFRQMTAECPTFPSDSFSRVWHSGRFKVIVGGQTSPTQPSCSSVKESEESVPQTEHCSNCYQWRTHDKLIKNCNKDHFISLPTLYIKLYNI